MTKPAIICLAIWAVFISYYYGIYYGMRKGIEIGVQRSGININCHKAFGEIK